MADIEAAGKRFLEALAKYIEWRLRQGNIQESGREPTEHVDRYGEYLEAVGVKSDEQLHKALMEHMRQMKDAGRVPPVDDDC